MSYDDVCLGAVLNAVFIMLDSIEVDQRDEVSGAVLSTRVAHADGQLTLENTQAFVHKLLECAAMPVSTALVRLKDVLRPTTALIAIEQMSVEHRAALLLGGPLPQTWSPSPREPQMPIPLQVGTPQWEHGMFSKLAGCWHGPPLHWVRHTGTPAPSSL